MADRAPFPSAQRAVAEVLAGFGSTGSRVPADLLGSLPFIRIQRTGGPDDLVFDSARVSIDVFTATDAESDSLSEAVRQHLLAVPHRTSVGLIDLVTTITGPAEIPWGDLDVRRYNASYTVSSRR